MGPLLFWNTSHFVLDAIIRTYIAKVNHDAFIIARIIWIKKFFGLIS